MSLWDEVWESERWRCSLTTYRKSNLQAVSYRKELLRKLADSMVSGNKDRGVLPFTHRD